MHQGTKAVEERLDRFFRDKLQPAIYRDHVALSITAWQAPREPVPFEVAANQQYEAVDLGWRFGRAWSTIWLKVSGEIPEHWNANDEIALAAEIQRVESQINDERVLRGKTDMHPSVAALRDKLVARVRRSIVKISLLPFISSVNTMRVP